MNSPADKLPEEELPESVRNVLRQASEVPFEVPQEKDAAILAAAGAVLAANRTVERPGRRRQFAAALSSVTAALLVLMLANWSESPESTVNPTTSAAQFVVSKSELAPLREDIDANGTVNILDAYVLARRLQIGEFEEHWDFNEDGAMDEHDIQHVPAEAVML